MHLQYIGNKTKSILSGEINKYGKGCSRLLLVYGDVDEMDKL